MNKSAWPAGMGLILGLALPAFSQDARYGANLRTDAPAGAASAPRTVDDRLDVPFMTNETHDPSVPSPESFLGAPVGARFTPHFRVVDYFRTLDRTSPRAVWQEYGRTYEGRPLGILILSSAANQSRLDEIRADNVRLFDADGTSREDAAEISGRSPLIVWLSYNVHGDEASATEAALEVAFQLAAGRSADGLLDSLVVIVDPCLNPDGRDRYVNFVTAATGRRPDPDAGSWEHDQPWPGGRYNHYLFDLNRDWAWRTQVETESREVAFLAWRPQVHVDFHEMSYTSSYFFFPASEPFNANLPAQVRYWGERFGRGNARAFDEHGWPFYTSEEFDLYYPGYGDSWPTLQGATGMTYEQAGHGRAGLEVQLRSGAILTLRERARHHFVASMATLSTARAERFARLMDFHAFFAEGITAPVNGPAAYLIPPGRDPDRVRELIELLQSHGARVERATETLKAPDARDYDGEPVHRDFPAGTYVVPARQPLRALVNALLEPEAVLPETLFYDITAWSLPLAFGVEACTVDREPSGRREPVTKAEPHTGGVRGDETPVAWLLPWTANAAPRLLNRLLSAGVMASFATKTFESGGLPFERGTIVIPKAANGDSLAPLIDRLAREMRIPVYAAGTAWTGSGIDLGSDRMVPLRTPRVAVVCGDGVDPTSFGAVWFLLDRQYEIPVTLIPLETLGYSDLARFNVMIFPDDDSGDGSSYSAALDSLSVDRVSRWVKGGGAFVGLRGGAAWATEGHSGLTSIRIKPEKTDEDSGNEEAEDDEERETDREAEIARKLAGIEEREKEGRLKRIPGTILRVKLDPAHPLSYGYDGEARILKTGTVVFEPGEAGTNVGYYPRSPRVSGYVSPDNEERLAETPFLIADHLGRGSVVLYNEDPNFRVFWYGLNRLFLNSIFFAGGY